MKAAGQTATSVSVIIPVFNAAEYLPPLFAALAGQQPAAPAEIILIDSASTDATRALAAQSPLARVIPIADFSHGRARNLGAQAARGEILVFLSQDALPADAHWLAALLAPFADDQVAAVYSRQVPRSKTKPMELFFLEERFPDGQPEFRRKREGETLTLERVFFSNVSAAIRRAVLLRYPFDETLVMSEDQKLVKTIMEAGGTIVYQPRSVALHSHNYSLADTFRRYFDSVYAFRQIFPQHTFGASSSVGLRYIRRETGFICRRFPLWLPYYALYNCAKAAATFAAHRADKMPRRWARRCSLQKYFWDRPADSA
jgi:rhamnosyltransferase